MSPKNLLVKVYRRLPSSFRGAIRSIKPLDDARRHYFEGDNRLHNLYYTDAYYDDCDDRRWAPDSAPTIAADIATQLAPHFVIDVGCGSGEYLEALRGYGIEVHGVELAAAALARCREKGLDVAAVDLVHAQALPWQADVVCSFEVAEHLPKSGARNFVRLVSSSCREHVVMTGGVAGATGVGTHQLPTQVLLDRALRRAGIPVRCGHDGALAGILRGQARCSVVQGKLDDFPRGESAEIPAKRRGRDGSLLEPGVKIAG